ncbi:hypothetical protein OG211_23235 [Streptomyces niveus]|uniref:Uncharacterized protein n=1 Tax=Streptomyces niveus TaxID=193462 RepID=A0ABZ2A2Q7_STRNV|nr:hypothetical protein [Streptomyces niveus]WTA61175.1 hypothetical protein OG211_23235 [Streptomyces niveus]
MSSANADITTKESGRRLTPLEMWRDLVVRDLSFYESPLSEEIRSEGRAQGRAEAVVLVLGQRGIAVPDESRKRITDCHYPDIQRRWLTRAVTAESLEEVFASD